MTEWEPATEAEAAMRDALRMSDQELYFRILARTELLLPVSADALAGRTAMGWGTWNSGGRTHVLSFTSPDAMRICLAENAGSARRIAFHDLANSWPNHDWWLAVNPGLPIEGYLPPWFVGQLARGDVRLPGRSGAARPNPAPGDPDPRRTGSPPYRQPPVAEPEPSYAQSASSSAYAQSTYSQSAYARSAYPPSTYGQPDAYGQPAPYDQPGAYDQHQPEQTRLIRPPASQPVSTPPASTPPSPAQAPRDYASSAYAQAPSSVPLEPDDVVDPEGTRIVDTAAARAAAASGARRSGAAGRTPGGRDPARRGRRYEASIIDATVIDAEIISSTVLGASAMDTMVIDATVVDRRRSAGHSDTDVLDVEVIDVTVESDPDDRTQAVNRPPKPATTPTAPKTAPKATAAMGARLRAAAAKAAAADAPSDAPGISAKPSFNPANEVEVNLLTAASNSKTDNFLSTLLLAKVLIPMPAGESAGLSLDDPSFPWRREVVDGQAYLVVFTSPERMTDFMGDGVMAVTTKFVQLIRMWPDVNWAFAVNPGTPVGATLPGVQIKALAVWAADVGLTADDPVVEYEEPEPPAPAPSTSPISMQKPIAPSQVDYYLDRGYDRASGFVHRATEVSALHTPEQIYATLGLSYTGSPFQRDASEIYVLRWAAHRGDLYRIPYGGQHEAGMRAMQGWLIERAPFRGNGFAPAERGEVIAEFKVDSIRLPHGAQMWRLTDAGERTLVAVFDADECLWRMAADAGISAEWDPTAPAVVTPPTVPASVPVGRPQQITAAGDPSEDPLDPRWRGKPTGRGSANWTATRVGER